MKQVWAVGSLSESEPTLALPSLSAPRSPIAGARQRTSVIRRRARREGAGERPGPLRLMTKVMLPRPLMGERSEPVQKKSSFFFSSSDIECTTDQKLLPARAHTHAHTVSTHHPAALPPETTEEEAKALADGERERNREEET